jgi:hypothetical protein
MSPSMATDMQYYFRKITVIKITKNIWDNNEMLKNSSENGK